MTPANILVVATIAILIVSVNCKNQPPKKKKKGQHKGPYFENVQPRENDFKDVDSREPIDKDKTIRQLIFPGTLNLFIKLKYFFLKKGTKWCGQGNVATHYGDLGIHQATDICCRNHDYCPDFIPAGETKFGLTNRAPYTKYIIPHKIFD